MRRAFVSTTAGRLSQRGSRLTMSLRRVSPGGRPGETIARGRLPARAGRLRGSLPVTSAGRRALRRTPRMQIHVTYEIRGRGGTARDREKGGALMRLRG